MSYATDGNLYSKSGKPLIPANECGGLLDLAKAAISDGRLKSCPDIYEKISGIFRYAGKEGGITSSQKSALAKRLRDYERIVKFNQEIESQSIVLEYFKIVDSLLEEREKLTKWAQDTDMIKIPAAKVKGTKTSYQNGNLYISRNFFGPPSSLIDLAKNLERIQTCSLPATSQIRELDEKCKEIYNSIDI